MQFKLYKLSYDADSINSLTLEERYTFVMLGHMFNEMTTLRRLLAFSFPTDSDSEPMVREAKFAQAMFILRIAAGKLWEAQQVIDNEVMSGEIQKTFLPALENGRRRWLELKAAKVKVKWISKVRNEVAFHYPSFKICKPLLEPSMGEKIDIFGSGKNGNTFHKSAEDVAQRIFFDKAGLDVERAQGMIDELLDYLLIFNGLVDELLGAFAQKRLQNAQVTSCSVDSPPFAGFTLPAFFSLEQYGQLPMAL